MTNTPEKKTSNSKHIFAEMTVGDHLSELRLRIIFCLLSVFVFFIAALFFSWDILSFISAPLIMALSNYQQPTDLLVTGIATGFTVYVKIAAVTALICSSPVILYHLWRFVSKGLYRFEQKYVKIFAPLSGLLFIIGSLFCLLIVAPVTINFFLGFNSQFSYHSGAESKWFQSFIPADDFGIDYSDDQKTHVPDISNIKSNLSRADNIDSGITTYCSVNEYVSFIINLTLAFGVAFQLPLAVLISGRIGIFSLTQLRAGRKYVFFAIIIFSAIITPPDVVSQLAMAVPMYLLYEFGLVLVAVICGRKNVKE